MDKEKTVKFLFVSMWITLILMVVLKLTFNYYYPIVIENSKLLEISKYIDEHKWLLYPLDFIIYIINATFISLCAIKEKWFKNKKHILILFISYAILFLLKIYNTWIAFIFTFVPYIIIPLIITKNKKRWIFIMFILDNLFQILSNFTRGNNLIINETFIINTFMWIDYYLLFIIYYIGGNYMGLQSWLPWFTKKETVINAKIEKLQKKIKKLEEQKQCLKKQ